MPQETPMTKYFECFHNKYSDKNQQCGALARWRSICAGNFTDGWTWCDEHVTPAKDFREPIDCAAINKQRNCARCGKEMTVISDANVVYCSIECADG